MFRPDMERSLWPFWPGTEKNRDKWDLFDWGRCKGNLVGEDQEDAGYRSKPTGNMTGSDLTEQIEMEIWRRVWYDLNGKISLQDGRHNDDNFVGNCVEKVNTELKNLSESREIEKMWNQF